LQRIELNYLSPRFHRRLMQLTAFDIEAGHPPQTVERALRALTRRMLLLSTSGFKPAATPSGNPNAGSGLRSAMAELAGAPAANRILASMPVYATRA